MTIVSTELDHISCGECGVPFAVPGGWLKERKESGGIWYCPNGHPRAFRDSENSKLKAQLQKAEAQAQQEREQREAAQRELERTKKRVSAGSCPCCKRHFKALNRHMTSKHPEYKAS